MVGYRLESTWTGPRDECPHPERWHAEDAQGTEAEVSELVGALVRALQPDLVVETGVWHGQTTRAIGEALARNGHGHLHAIEKDEELAAKAAIDLADLPVTVHNCSSLDFTPPGQVDFAWLDSDMGTRVPEIDRYWPHIHPRTVIAIHDTGSHRARFRAELDKLADRLALIHLPTPRGVTLARVR